MVHAVATINWSDIGDQVQRPNPCASFHRFGQIVLVEGVFGVDAAADIALAKVRASALVRAVAVDERSGVLDVPLFAEINFEIGIIVEADTPEDIVADFRRLGIAITRAS